MKLLGAIGFEWGQGVWSNSDVTSGTDYASAIGFINAAFGGGVFGYGAGNTAVLNHSGSAGTKYATPDGANLKGGYLTIAYNANIEKLRVIGSFAYGVEVSCSYYEASTANDNYYTARFDIGGNTYIAQLTSNAGWRVSGGSSPSKISGTNTTNKSSNVWETLYVRAWDDGSDLYIYLVSSVNPADFVLFKDVGVTGTITDVCVGNMGPSGGIDDVTAYEIESGDTFAKTSWSVFDLKPQLLEIVPCCKSTNTYTANVQSHADNDPTDWTNESGSQTEANVWDSMTDGNDLTNASSNTEVVGSESVRTATQIAADSGLLIGNIHAISISGWKVADDDGQSPQAALTCPGYNSGAQEKKSATGVTGSNGMTSQKWDFSGLTNSDDNPLASSTSNIKGGFST